MKCSLCNVDLEKETHHLDCPYEGVGDESAMIKKWFGRGWECPRCLRVYSPMTQECLFCNKKLPKE